MSPKRLNSSRRSLKIQQRRTFSEAFKRQKVKEIVNCQVTVAEISTLYNVSKTAVYKWLYKYSQNHSPGTIQVVQMESESQKTKLYQQRIVELERIVGQKQLEIDFLNKLVEISSQELGLDLKKNFGTKPSIGFEAINPDTATKSSKS